MVGSANPEDVFNRVIGQQQRMLDSQRRDFDKRYGQLFDLLQASIQNGAGGQALADAAQKHIEQIEKNFGGLAFRRPDLDAGQWEKLDTVLAAMEAADLKRDMRVEPWAYVPATDPRAVAEATRLLEKRRDLEEKVQQQQQQRQQPPTGAVSAAAN